MKAESKIKNLESKFKFSNDEYLNESKYKVSDSVVKSDILRLGNDIICKEKELINAIETYLKLECHELYKKNNLEEIFKKARCDENIKLKVFNTISNFILN